ncbi:DUF2975 domain-containing protein [Bifidobacterium aerophilum]|uniref:DUF2975 domain-containing protein n=2 Tax=Bifidobacterium aerophilum TaxID=1798155 RepID=A0A6N9Z5B0_9BIFI|nr:DUF2975 domain-containing protein [Bifidobacterium aerophilum]
MGGDVRTWREFHPKAIAALKVLIVLFELICLWGQVAVYVAAGDFVSSYPEFATARWPYTMAGLLGIACFEVALVPLWNLLTLVKRRDVFSGKAIFWDNVIIGCAGAEGALVLFVLLYGSFAHGTYLDAYRGVTLDVAMGAFALSLACAVALLLIVAFVLLMLVMRSLLAAAIAQRDELEAVI